MCESSRLSALAARVCESAPDAPPPPGTKSAAAEFIPREVPRPPGAARAAAVRCTPRAARGSCASEQDCMWPELPNTIRKIRYGAFDSRIIRRIRVIRRFIRRIPYYTANWVTVAAKRAPRSPRAQRSAPPRAAPRPTPRMCPGRDSPGGGPGDESLRDAARAVIRRSERLKVRRGACVRARRPSAACAACPLRRATHAGHVGRTPALGAGMSSGVSASAWQRRSRARGPDDCVVCLLPGARRASRGAAGGRGRGAAGGGAWRDAAGCAMRSGVKRGLPAPSTPRSWLPRSARLLHLVDALFPQGLADCRAPGSYSRRVARCIRAGRVFGAVWQCRLSEGKP